MQMYLLQVESNLSDKETEDIIFDGYVMQKFMGINYLEEDALNDNVFNIFQAFLSKVSVKNI